jgi:hypothetical protein
MENFDPMDDRNIKTILYSFLKEQSEFAAARDV